MPTWHDIAWRGMGRSTQRPRARAYVGEGKKWLLWNYLRYVFNPFCPFDFLTRGLFRPSNMRSSAVAAAFAAASSLPATLALQSDLLSVQVGDNISTYALSVGGKVWLESGPTRLSGETLEPFGHTEKSTGKDALGTFHDLRQDFTCTSGTRDSTSEEVCFSTIVRDYTPDLPLVVFLQNHTTARSNTATDPIIAVAKEQVLSAFPSWQVLEPSEESLKLGYLTYFDQMVGGMENGTRFGEWSKSTQLVGGTMGGPTVLFDADQSYAMVLSPWQNFLAGSSVQRSQPSPSDDASVLEFGLMGSIDSIPEGFEFATAAFVGTGVNDAVRGFGDCLLKFHGKTQAASRTPWDGSNGDLSLSKLGVSTDNGAYMYYNHGPNATSEEEALIKVHDSAADVGIPFRYILLDSWWYYKGVGGGVKNWTATPDTFPHGIANFTQYTQWPVVGHNRYWAVDTDYAKQNGGDFDFILEPENGKGIPTEQAFWDFLMKSSKEWGLSVYEQDWLHNEWEGLNATLQSATLGREWLLQMGNGAAKNDIFIQYCMAYARFALASVEVPVVDQIRVSDDYYVDLTHDRSFSVNAYIGTSSMLAAALALAPSKDVFWSSSDEPGYPSKYTPQDPKHFPYVREDHPALEAALATLSAGPVSPGDGVGMTNKSLIMCSCNEDGTLLKPSWPATPVDSYFSARAGISTDGPEGELYATYTNVASKGSSADTGDTYTVAHILAMDMASDFQLSLSTELPTAVRASGAESFFTWSTNTAECGDITAPTVAHSASSLKVAACGKADFQVLHAAPEINCESSTDETVTWGLLGEVGKWVPVSPQRFQSVQCAEGGGLQTTVTGSEGEVVNLRFARKPASANDDTTVVTVQCTIGSTGTAVADSGAGTCK